jgi:putative ABC transport system substrate-binding protein
MRRSGSYVDRILRGVKPGALQVQVPTEFEMAIRVKVAKDAPARQCRVDPATTR